MNKSYCSDNRGDMTKICAIDFGDPGFASPMLFVIGGWMYMEG
jgi:hypothetical protein